MIIKLQTTYPSNNYPIFIKHNTINHINTYIDQFDQNFILINKHINQYFTNKFNNILSYKNIHKIIIPSNKKTKTFKQYQKTLKYILSHHITHNTTIITINNNTTKNFTKFITTTLLKNIHFIQIPTTILTHNSNINNKININSKQNKNLINTFYHPTTIIYNLNFLKTLPFKQILNNYTKIYKHTLLNNKSTTQNIKQHFKNKKILQSLNNINKYITKNIKTKLNIIITNKKKQNIHKFLNLNHTFKHTIKYYHKIPHNHTIIINIIYQFIITNTLFNSKHNINHYIQYLIQLNYPLNIITNLNFKTLYKYILNNKKNNKQNIQIILIKQFKNIIIQHIDQLTLQHTYKQLKTYFK